MKLYTSNEVARLSKVSLRQLQWWHERGIVNPRIEGNRRLFTAHQAWEVKFIAQLKSKGVGLKQIRYLLPLVEKAKETFSDVSRFYMLTNGRLVHFCNSEAEVVAELKKRPRPYLLIEIPTEARPR